MTVLLEAPALVAPGTVGVWDAGVVPCGFPQPSAQEFRERIRLDDILIADHEATFLMRCRGSSMSDDGIEDGDVVIVDRAMDPQVGDDIVAVVDGEFTLKRLARRDGRTVLAAMNPEHPDVAVSEFSETSVFGVVTYVIKRKSRRVRAG